MRKSRVPLSPVSGNLTIDFPVKKNTHRIKKTSKTNKKKSKTDNENVCSNPASYPSLVSPRKSHVNSPCQVQHSSPRKEHVNSPCRLQLISSRKEILISPGLSNLTSDKCSLYPSETKSSPRKVLMPSSRHLAQSPGKGSPQRQATPKKCLQSPRSLASTPKKCLFSPEKPCSPLKLVRQKCAQLQKAKKALHTALPDSVLGREKEAGFITEFVDEHLSSCTAGSLYVSGAPGTGKTAVLSHLLHRLKSRHDCVVVYINCMSFSSAQSIYLKALCELTDQEYSLSQAQAAKRLLNLITKSKKMIVMVLDEMDQLDNKHQDVLYTMFEWPSHKNSKLLLIGIANALDLTDRILPRLQASPECKPTLLHFPPYTKEQIMNVLQSRLKEVLVDQEQVLDKNAIMFCARRVSAVAGDMRKALDICRRSVEVMEGEVRKQRMLIKTKENISPCKRILSASNKISIADISKIVNEVYGSRTAEGSSNSTTIPLQQKIAICTLLAMLKSGRYGKEVTVGKLHEKFSSNCQQQFVGSLQQAELFSVCELLDARGIFSLKRNKDPRNTKVSLRLDEEEVAFTLQDSTLMANILKN